MITAITRASSVICDRTEHGRFASMRQSSLVAAVLSILAVPLVWWSFPAAAGKSGESVQVTIEQMRQIGVFPVESYAFHPRKIAIGQITYNEDVSTVVLSPFAGRVTRLIAKMGDKVALGDPLLEIDSLDVLPPQNDYVAALGVVNKARSQYELAKIAESRHKGLFEAKAGALKEWQQAQTQLVAAENDMRSAETALEAARRRLRIIGRTDEEIAALAARGMTSRATVIRAPISGTVIARKVSIGQYVRAESAEPLYAISDLSTMWLRALVPENDLGGVRIGDELEGSVSGLSDRMYKARVRVIGALSDVTTHRVEVRSEIANPDGALKSEMFASITIETGEGHFAPAVPVEAVIGEANLDVVWVEKEPLVFQRRQVTLGVEQDGRFEIREGLKVGEMIVGSGAIFLEYEWQQ